MSVDGTTPGQAGAEEVEGGSGSAWTVDAGDEVVVSLDAAAAEDDRSDAPDTAPLPVLGRTPDGEDGSPDADDPPPSEPQPASAPEASAEPEASAPEESVPDEPVPGADATESAALDSPASGPDAPGPDVPGPDAPGPDAPGPETPAAVAAPPPEPEPSAQAEPDADGGESPSAPESPSTTPAPEAVPVPDAAAAPVTGPTGWAAVAKALRPHHVTRGQALAGALCAILGFGLVVQVHQTSVSGLASLKPADLVQVLARLTGESARLEEEAQGLQRTRERLAGGDLTRAAAEESARQRMQVLAILAGTAPAQGPGIDLAVSDPKGKVGSAQILDAVQELRDAGAEALQFGGGGQQIRVVANTSFVDADGGGIVAGGTVLKPPFTLLVIGDPDTLTAALGIPGGVEDVMEGLGAKVTITPQQDLRVEALAATVQYRYAKPVTTG